MATPGQGATREGGHRKNPSIRAARRFFWALAFPLPSQLVLILGLLLAPGWGWAQTQTKAERDLKQLVEQQKMLLSAAEKKENQADLEDLRSQFQQLCYDYERFLRQNPDLAAGYVSYALLLGKPLIGERRRAVALLLKANQLDKNIPLVKNQLGNFLAEEGRPREALNYFLAAVQLAPEEPLYHYQVGTLLAEARDDFLQSGEWTRADLESAMQRAFEQAMVLAPGNLQYAYRYAESFYDLEHPEWKAALEVWRALEQKASPGIEQQTMRLHQANVLIKQKDVAAARALLDTVTEPVLAGQKEKLIAELASASAK